MKVFLVIAAIVAATSALELGDHEAIIQHHIQSSSSSEERKARFEPLHQIHQGLKSSSSSSEEQQQLHQGRFEPLHQLHQGLKSSSSSEEQHHEARFEPLDQIHQGLKSSSSSSEEQHQLNKGRFEPLHQIHQGLKSSSSSSEEKPIARSDWQSSSSSEERRPISNARYEHDRPSRRESQVLGVHQQFSSSSEEQHRRPIQKRFLGFFESEEEAKRGRDELHKIKHFEHVSSSRERANLGVGPTHLEGTYHVSYDPPTVVQAPLL